MSDAAPPFAVVAFHRTHTRRPFVCGQDALDRYWSERASQDQRRRVAAVFVLVDNDSDAIAGYYTLAAASVALTGLPVDMQRRLPRYPEIPVALLGRLAVAEAYQGKGLGAMLVFNAAHRMATNTDLGCLALVADPLDENAQAFYSHLGFQVLQGNDRRLFAPLDALVPEGR